MPANVRWNSAPLTAFVADGIQRALNSANEFGESYWKATAPVGTDPRTAGGLRDSWYGYTWRLGNSFELEFGAATRYAIYVELGTSKMGPRAPLRTTAGEVVAILPSYFANELRIS